MSMRIFSLNKNLKQNWRVVQKRIRFDSAIQFSTRVRHCAQGFSLMEAMVALVVLGVVSWGMMGIFQTMNRDQRRLSTLFQLQQIQKNISTLVSSDGAWSEIVKNNEVLKCLVPQSTTPCVNGVTEVTSLFTAGGAAFFDSTAQGFGLNGEVCAVSSPLCKIRLKFMVELTCPGTPAAATCGTPDQIVFRGTFSPFDDESGRSFLFNPANYAINVRKDSAFAAGGGSQVLEFTCGFIRQNKKSAAPESEFNGGLSVNTECTVQACPQGYSQIGEISTRNTSAAAWGSMLGGESLYVTGYLSRYCVKN